MSARKVFAVALGIVALWALVLQFGIPVILALREEVPAATYVRWDAWWTVHLALAWQLLRPGSAAWLFAVVISWTEIAIVGARLALFLSSPARTFWTMNLALNRLAILALFLALAFYLHRTRAGRDLGRPH